MTTKQPENRKNEIKQAIDNDNKAVVQRAREKASRAEQLQTREQKWRASKNDRMFVPRSLALSPAFLTLRASSIKVYMLFMTKRKIERIPGARKGEYAVTNNGQITLTYKEARRKLKLWPDTFKNAIDQLVATGFIDIAESSGGLHKQTTKYAISDRWRKYGTPEFKTTKRQKRRLQYGFSKTKSTQ